MSLDDDDAKFRKMCLALTKEDRQLLKTYCCEHGYAWRHGYSPLCNRAIYELRILKEQGETAESRKHIICPYPKPDNKFLWWEDFDWDAENPWPDQVIAETLDICHYCYSNCYILGPCPIRSRVSKLERLGERMSCPPVKQGEELTRWERFLIENYQIPLQAVLASRIPVEEYEAMMINKEKFENKT